MIKKNVIYIGKKVLTSNDFSNLAKLKKLYFSGEENKITVKLFNSIPEKTQIIICNGKPLEFYAPESNKNEYILVQSIEPSKNQNQENKSSNSIKADIHVDGNINMNNGDSNANDQH